MDGTSYRDADAEPSPAWAAFRGPVGTPRTRLVVVRGNSGSGKSSIAAGLRAAHGRGLAVVGQDNLRRVVLKDRDVPDAANIGLIGLTVRYALDHGFHVVLEGILGTDHYGDMLAGLLGDHRGPTHCYYLDVPFEETLVRHATKPQVDGYGEAELRDWWRPDDRLPGGVETVIGHRSSLDDSVARILRDSGLGAAG